MDQAQGTARAIGRRRFLAGLGGAAAAAAFLAACGDTEKNETPSPSPSPSPSPTATGTGTGAPGATATAIPDEASAFPVTIEHQFGSVVIPAQPERVITIGFSEQDPVLALGVVPVAVREWFGGKPYAVWPWAEDALGNGMPEVFEMPFGELDFERIAALRPDLIVATHSGITLEEYDTLDQIAPTLAQPGDYPDFGVPWQEQTRLIGRALGREDRGDELVAKVEAAIAETAAAHPEWVGATVAWITPADEGQYWLTGPNTPPLRFLSDLGFTMPDGLREIVGEESAAQISGEQVALLDVDALISQVYSEEGRAAAEADPLFTGLDVAREGRIVFFTALDDPVYGALSFSTVLSLPYALEYLTPRLVAALDGDPATGLS